MQIFASHLPDRMVILATPQSALLPTAWSCCPSFKQFPKTRNKARTSINDR